MLKSMTGYGTASATSGNYEIVAEVKSLNSKFADISIRIPAQWSSLELSLRKIITDQMVRGKISASIEVATKAEALSTVFDEQMLIQYYNQFKQVAGSLESVNSDLFGLALHAPGVLKTKEETLNDDLSEDIKRALNEAVEHCEQFRLQEGKELEAKLTEYAKSIGSLLTKIDPFDKDRISKIEEKLKAGLAGLSNLAEVDSNRFEQELIYYIEKFDINEEKVRLQNHLEYFMEILGESDSNGKKLGFIAQEIGREINTIGSKANDSRIQRIVVEMKEELEKIKEQALNLL